MHDRGLLLMLCRDNEMHIAAPFPEIGFIITHWLYIVKEIHVLSEKIE